MPYFTVQGILDYWVCSFKMICEGFKSTLNQKMKTSKINSDLTYFCNMFLWLFWNNLLRNALSMTENITVLKADCERFNIMHHSNKPLRISIKCCDFLPFLLAGLAISVAGLSRCLRSALLLNCLSCVFQANGNSKVQLYKASIFAFYPPNLKKQSICRFPARLTL